MYPYVFGWSLGCTLNSNQIHMDNPNLLEYEIGKMVGLLGW